MASLGGLASLVRLHKPDIIFLQECTLRDASLRARAPSLGFVAHQSALDPTRQLRQLVTLVKLGLQAEVSDLVSGNLQGVRLGALSFLHVHAPLDSHPVDKVTHGRIFREAAALFVTGSCDLPVLIGDFNCVQDALDTTANHKSKFCRPLDDFLRTFPLLDAFRHLHPRAREFRFCRPGVAHSLLDRAYLPRALMSSVVSVAHLATTSDHAALVVALSGSPLGQQPPSPPAPESYWKLNSSILSEPDFGSRFAEAWQALCSDRPDGVPASVWWEDYAKPFFRDFCQRFAKMVAHRRRETRNFLQLALGAVLKAEDWARVRG
jgi:endonuclease/exonuclease/phosphatase family metal-dependent hydrolase